MKIEQEQFGKVIRSFALLITLMLLSFPLVETQAASKRWDSQQDWSKGVANNTTFKKVPGQIQIHYDPNEQTYLKTPYIYVPNSGRNTVVKLDTRTGEILWTFNLSLLKVGSNPSRTTVDSKGNVWVGLRGGNHIVAITSKGKHLTSVKVGSGPRAITIDENGDIWAGGYYAKSVVKISHKTLKVVHTIRHASLRPYGAATDTLGNVWFANRATHNLSQINVNTGKIVKFYSAKDVYGIAADRNGYVWASSYSHRKLHRYDSRTGTQKSYNLGARGRGVAVDGKGHVWIACSHDSRGRTTRRVERFDPKLGRVIKSYTNVGYHTIGVAIDDKGFVWANSYSEGKAYKLSPLTHKIVATYPVCDLTGTKPCANSGCKPCSRIQQATPYTYSDMTGFQLQFVIRPAQGEWTTTFDARCKTKFSSIRWNGNHPKGTNVRVHARTASTKSGLRSASWGPYVASGSSLRVSDNRWIEFQFLMETKNNKVTPTVTDTTLSYNHYAEICDGIDNNCNGQIDEHWSNKGKSCSVGNFSCKRTGKWICAPNKRSIVCSAKATPAKTEICDGKDNDCDGKVDEGFPAKNQPCHVGQGSCRRTGKYICRSDKRGTTCSAKPGRPSKEICDGKDNDCDGSIDEDFPKKDKNCSKGVGGCLKTGKWACKADGSSTVCLAKTVRPTPEKCDGLDNDCDGNIDENWPKKGKICRLGLGACAVSGKWLCKKDGSGIRCSATPRPPKPEICDGIDNDCNGKSDDRLIKNCSTTCGKGSQKCIGGNWTSCTAQQPKKESCDNTDEDCDGRIDNGLVRGCSTVCDTGQETCVRGKWTLCSAQQPKTEICDKQDNDCNGKIDDGLKPKTCQGACGKGTAVCQDGKWSGCSGPRPETEVCDGKDNDCDGKADENLSRACRTACDAGKQRCYRGKWQKCSAPPAHNEICDGKDNNCDGKIDGPGLCPSGMTCNNGKCKVQCAGECVKGLRCVKGVCQGDVCDKIKCSKGKVCVSSRCVDLCYSVSCPQGQTCKAGICSANNCYTKGCPKGQRCEDAKCQKDPCKDVSCKTNEFCRDGKCIHSCAKVDCDKGKRCRDGSCEPDPRQTGSCKDVQCKSGTLCENGKCVADVCKNIQCAKGLRCHERSCVHDRCSNIECPKGQRCHKAQCVAPKPNEPDTENNSTEESTKGNEKNNGSEGSKGKENNKGSEGSKGKEDNKGKESSTSDAGSTKDSGSGSHNNPTGDKGGRYDAEGCNCQSNGIPQTPTILFWLLLATGFIFRTRRRKNK